MKNRVDRIIEIVKDPMKSRKVLCSNFLTPERRTLSFYSSKI
jgi:hypothetical protein